MVETTNNFKTQKTSEDQQWSKGAEEFFSPTNLTSARPFCAGVLIVNDDRLLVTLSADGSDARDADGMSWFVGGVGSGRESGESLWDCAQREAFEELGAQLNYSHHR